MTTVTIGKEKGDQPPPENTSVDPTSITTIRKSLKDDEVLEGWF